MDRWSVGLDVVADLMTDFLGEALDEEFRELEHEGFKGSSRWSVQARYCGPARRTSKEWTGSVVEQPAVR